MVKIFELDYDREWIEPHPIKNKSVGKRQVPPQLCEYNCYFIFLDY